MEKRAEEWQGLTESSALLFNVDVKSEKSLAAFKDEVFTRAEKIDVLINCAGVGYFSAAEELNVSQFEDMLSTNLTGTFLACQLFGREMLKQGSGKIFNIVSIAGKEGLAGCAGYSASKFGVSGLSKVLQNEWRSKGIQVTAVYPGSINSSFWDSQSFSPDKEKMIPSSVFAHSLVSLIQLPGGSFVDELTIMPPNGIL
jgi:3-oxoacyl-[acyl-carrier protein] reductase